MDDQSHIVMPISHLREVLGYACQQVARSGDPIVVQRYNRRDVILVPLVDWEYLNQLATQVLAEQQLMPYEGEENAD